MWGRMSAAKPPHAAPGLAARGGTAVAPCHKGAPCPTGPVSACLCPKPPRPAVRARPSAAPLPALPHVHLRLLHASLSPATADCSRRCTRTSASSVPPRHQPPPTAVRYRGRRRTRTSASSVPPRRQPPPTVVRYRGRHRATIFSEQCLVSADERRPASQAASTLELHLHRAVAVNPSW
jgi:hypothetical protein